MSRAARKPGPDDTTVAMAALPPSAIDWRHTPLALLLARTARRTAGAAASPGADEALTDELALVFGQPRETAP